MFIYTTKKDIVAGFFLLICVFIGTYLGANGQMEQHNIVSATVVGITIFFITAFVKPYRKFKKEEQEINKIEDVDNQTV